MTLRSAIVAIDFMQDAWIQLEAALPWLDHLDVRADLTWVDRHASVAFLSRYPMLAQSLIEYREAMHDIDHTAMAGMIASLPEGRRGEAHVLEGDPALALAGEAADFDMVVIGTSHVGGTWTTSGTGERIVRHSPRPVLVVRPGPVPAHPRVLVAVDVNHSPAELLREAASWVTTAASFDLVYATPPDISAWEGALPHRDDPGSSPSGQASMQARLDELARSMVVSVPVRTHCVRGAPFAVIDELSKDYDLVVIGTHGRTGLGRMWAGSVAERVCREADTSVLVVHVGA